MDQNLAAERENVELKDGTICMATSQLDHASHFSCFNDVPLTSVSGFLPPSECQQEAPPLSVSWSCPPGTWLFQALTLGGPDPPGLSYHRQSTFLDVWSASHFLCPDTSTCCRMELQSQVLGYRYLAPRSLCLWLARLKRFHLGSSFSSWLFSHHPTCCFDCHDRQSGISEASRVGKLLILGLVFEKQLDIPFDQLLKRTSLDGLRKCVWREKGILYGCLEDT